MSDIRTNHMTDEQLRREVKQSRQRVAADVDALGEKLEPDNLKREATDAARHMKDDAVAHVKLRARETGGHAKSEIQSNPWPYALMGAGLTWLLLDQVTKRTERGRHARARIADAGSNGHTRERASELKQRAHTKMDRASERWESTKTKAGNRYDDARLAATQAKERGGVIARDAGARTEGFYMDHPLMIGGISMAAGVGLGLLLPATRRELEAVGSTSADMQDRAVEMGHELADRARDIARETAKETQHRAREAAEDIEIIVKESADELEGEAEETLERAKSSSQRSPHGTNGGGASTTSS